MPLGNSMEEPFKEQPVEYIEGEFLVAGGVVIASAVLPVEGEFHPALVFNFAKPEGGFYPPVLLVQDPDQIVKLEKLVAEAAAKSVSAAIEQAEQHRGEQA